MSTLIEKIKASAATRLPLAPGRKPAEELARYKAYLKVETHRLKILHRAGAGGIEICRARAAVLDELIRHLFDSIRSDPALAAELKKFPVAIIATGGYGRGELNPFSDIDIMFLHDGEMVTGGKARPFMSTVVDGLLYTLWDVGLKVGHAVRSVEDCVKVANADMQSKTSLLEARLVTGDEPLFKRMQAVVIAKCIRGYEDAYVASRLQDQAERRSKYGDSACMQEPNLKNGCGGLRDYQNLMWMAFFKYRLHSFSELQTREHITVAERKQLEAAYDFILRVRNELHYHIGRATDALTKSAQAAVSWNLGYTSRSPVTRIEAFMRDLYTHLRNVYILTRNVEQRLALLPQNRRLSTLAGLFRPGLLTREQIIDGFKVTATDIRATSLRVFRDAPRRLMRVFLIAQQRGLPLNPDLAGLARNQVSLVDREFVHDEHVRETFLEILGQRGNVAPTLRAMHEIGLLGKYLPEFGKLTCLVQHEFYHQYAADEHTLMCIAKLDAVWGAREEPNRRYGELFQNIERPWVLYLALLLHDTGKSERTGKHAVTGANIATSAARRLHLDGTTAHTLRLLVEHHLDMVQISQRRDLDDPAVIRQFAQVVQNREQLDLLTLHTYADSLGTADNLWNGFKNTLLWSMHHKTADALEGGTQFLRAEVRQRELLLEEVQQQLPAGIGRDEIEAHFATLPPRYFQIHTSEEIATDIQCAHDFMWLQLSEDDRALAPVITWRNEPDRGYTMVQVCTWDRPGLFGKIAGSLTASGLNILGAQIFTRGDGIVLDTFLVIDARTGKLADRTEKEGFEQMLGEVLTGEVNLTPLIARRAGRPLYLALDRDPLPTRISFDNQTSDQCTVIDVETDDRVGLLFAISTTLSELGVDISLAKILTEKGAAFDSFYVAEEEGGKIMAPARQHFIEARLRAAVAKLDA